MTDIAALALSVMGWAGAAASIGAYAMVTQGRIAPDTLLFQGLNIGGAAALATSATVNQAWPSAVVNVIWIAIGVQALMSMYRAALGRRVRAVAAALPRPAGGHGARAGVGRELPVGELRPVEILRPAQTPGLTEKLIRI